jgi:hypothetical protein
MPTVPDSPELARPTKRGRRMSELAALDEVHLRPCATDLGVWAEVPAARVAAVQAEGRRPVLASGCVAVSSFLAEPSTVEVRPPRGAPPQPEHLHALFKTLFARGDWVATPSVPSTLAVGIARRSGMVLVCRAVSGTPQRHGAGAAGAE